jgi:predicted phage-related endonuclease
VQSEDHDEARDTNEVYDLMAAAGRCHSVPDFLSTLTASADQRALLEQETRDQATCSLWHTARAGRLTASNFYRVFTKVNSLKKNPHADLDKLISSILSPPDLSSLTHINHGKQLEEDAIKEALIRLSTEHDNIKGQRCGLFIHPEKQYLAATPDHIVTCQCHGEALLEVKCPTRELIDLDYLDKDNRLKQRSAYYGQVQGQMAVTGKNVTYFFVYKSQKEHIMDKISSDEKFQSQMLQNLSIFYTQYLAPKLIIMPQSKKTKLV